MSKWPYVGKSLKFIDCDESLRQVEYEEVITSVTAQTVYYIKTVGHYNGVVKTHHFKFNSLEEFEQKVNDDCSI